ncbi:uncharacterized protein EI97DRAFT_267411 [Westerdykella ornata]|uniref:F-box domain-containing protein n=1 Tax=Westerdykella ornata TaxID=318751 RepID=A0A6A6J5M1_WESOR|nr:uncharacterized protein EI97DRAFT_267411 [Westerdykella ornata]KAF2271487.1 hypothetical protein EI97DRAFT_267411 [Westerdykella ornata]
MAQLLSLPRELRDMIYMALITAERPRPDFKRERWTPKSHKLYSYCATRPIRPPVNCAGMLQCSRQVHREMSEAIEEAKAKQLAALKLDYFIMDAETSIATWLRIPIVETKGRVGRRQEKAEGTPKWRIRIPGSTASAAENHDGCPHAISRPRCVCGNSSTLLHQLWVDVRYARTLGHEDELDAVHCQVWGICATLVDVLERGGNWSREAPSCNIAMIDELVLNVVSPRHLVNGIVQRSRGTQTTDSTRELDSEAAWVARRVLGVWDTLWTSDASSKPFRLLLERIRRVRMCIDGETWRVRELQPELERGWAEQRRIAARLMH